MRAFSSIQVGPAVVLLLLCFFSAVESRDLFGLEELKLEELNCTSDDGVFCPAEESSPLGAWCPHGFQCEGGIMKVCPKGKDSRGAYDTCSWTTTTIVGFGFLISAIVSFIAVVAAFYLGSNLRHYLLGLTIVLVGVGVVTMVLGLQDGAPDSCPETYGEFCPTGSTLSRPCPTGHTCKGNGKAIPCCDSESFGSAPTCQSLCPDSWFAVAKCTKFVDHTCFEQDPEGKHFLINCVNYTSSCSDLRNIQYCTEFARAAEFGEDELWTCDTKACHDADAIRRTSFELYLVNFGDMVMNFAVLIPKVIHSFIGLPQMGTPSWTRTFPVALSVEIFELITQVFEAGLVATEVHIVSWSIPEAFDRFRGENCIQRGSDYLVTELASDLQTLRLIAPLQLVLSIVEILITGYLIHEIQSQRKNQKDLREPLGNGDGNKMKEEAQNNKVLLYTVTLSTVGSVFSTFASTVDFAFFTVPLRRHIERLYEVHGGGDDSVWCLRSTVADKPSCDDSFFANPVGAGNISVGDQVGVVIGGSIGLTILFACLVIFQRSAAMEEVEWNRNRESSSASASTSLQANVVLPRGPPLPAFSSDSQQTYPMTSQAAHPMPQPQPPPQQQPQTQAQQPFNFGGLPPQAIFPARPQFTNSYNYQIY